MGDEKGVVVAVIEIKAEFLQHKVPFLMWSGCGALILIDLRGHHLSVTIKSRRCFMFYDLKDYAFSFNAEMSDV